MKADDVGRVLNSYYSHDCAGPNVVSVVVVAAAASTDLFDGLSVHSTTNWNCYWSHKIVTV